MSNLRLKLITTKKTPEYTEGVLIYLNDNKMLCDTLEDTIRDVNGNGKFDVEEKKVYGKTAILSGVFDLEIVYSPSFKKEVVLISGTPEFTHIYFHYGFDEDNSLGCVLVGKKTKEGELKNIGMTDMLVELLKKHGGKGTVTIER